MFHWNQCFWIDFFKRFTLILQEMFFFGKKLGKFFQNWLLAFAMYEGSFLISGHFFLIEGMLSCTKWNPVVQLDSQNATVNQSEGRPRKFRVTCLPRGKNAHL